MVGRLTHPTTTSIAVIALDANAKTSYDPEIHPPHVLGPFTKKGSTTNNNGHRLIQFAAENKLFLSNTKFRHKPAHTSTRTAPYKPIRMRTGEINKQPIRNQIDYVLKDNKHLQFVTDSRSFGNINTDSDHYLVLITLKLQLSRLNRPKKGPNPPNKCWQFQEIIQH